MCQPLQSTDNSILQNISSCPSNYLWNEINMSLTDDVALYWLLFWQGNHTFSQIFEQWAWWVKDHLTNAKFLALFYDVGWVNIIFASNPHYRTPPINAQCWSMPIKIMSLILNLSQCWSLIGIDRHWDQCQNFDRQWSALCNDWGSPVISKRFALKTITIQYIWNSLPLWEDLTLSLHCKHKSQTTFPNNVHIMLCMVSLWCISCYHICTLCILLLLHFPFWVPSVYAWQGTQL